MTRIDDYRSAVRGFTIVELLVTMAVLGTLMALAAPSFFSFLVSTRLTSQAGDFVSDILLARGEAAARGRWVVMCASSDGAACSGSADWADGRIVFVDVDRDGSRTAASEALLRRVDALSGTPTVTAAGFPNSYLTFSPYGAMVPAGTTGSFSICFASSAEGRLITIGTNGRPTSAKGACP